MDELDSLLRCQESTGAAGDLGLKVTPCFACVFPRATPFMGSCIRPWIMLSSRCSCAHNSWTADLSVSRSWMVASVVGSKYAKPLYSRRSPHHLGTPSSSTTCFEDNPGILCDRITDHWSANGKPAKSVRLDVSMVHARILVMKDRHKQRSPYARITKEDR